jgi:hypothetical protein
MGIIELLVGVVFALALGTGVSLTMGGDGSTEFLWARICYLIAAAALVAAYAIWLRSSTQLQTTRILIGILIGGLVFAGTPELFRWVDSRQNKQTALNTIVRSQTDVPSLGSLAYLNFIAEIQRQVSTMKTSVQMKVKVRNNNNFLIAYHAHLSGQIGARSSLPIDFDGFIPANQSGELIFTRLDDVKVDESSVFPDPVLSGFLRYVVTYWAASSPTGTRRTTARTCEFALTEPFTPPSRFKPGQLRQSMFETTIRFSDEIEK